MNKTIFLIVALTAALALTGCFRKSVDSSPPAKRPVARKTAGPADKPGIISETHTVGRNQPPAIERTVDAQSPTVIDHSASMEDAEGNEVIEEAVQVKKSTKPDIGGDDLADETQSGSRPATSKPAAGSKIAANDPAAKAAFEPAPDPEDEQVMPTPARTKPVVLASGPYYVQVGAFSDLENANKVLTGLLADGYIGAMLKKVDTMYRVLAGAFGSRDDAVTALNTLKDTFPHSYVLKVE